ncbi:hypothetical protein BSKO_10265 [Bryopsis sp. KO-2023]|nr:hypothetical protein BSKO_10265 [Bryopsis sp. KO-2023]
MSLNRKTEVSPDQDKRHKKVLTDLLKEEHNRFCADCGVRGPTWASVNLGAFMCLTCSGIHRSLGVHISQVRSTNLDKWLPSQVAFVKCTGNEIVNKFWEKRLPAGYRRPKNDSHEISRFIQEKYIDKRYCDLDAQPPTIDNYQNHPYVLAKLGANPPSPAPASPLANGAVVVGRSQTPTPRSSNARPSLAPRSSTPVVPAASFDLLGMDDPTPMPPSPNSVPGGGNEWASFQGAPAQVTSTPQSTQRAESPSGWTAFEAAPPKSPIVARKSSAPQDPFWQTGAHLSVMEPSPPVLEAQKPAEEKKKSVAEDILKLYDAPGGNGIGGGLPPNLGLPMGNIGGAVNGYGGHQLHNMGGYHQQSQGGGGFGMGGMGVVPGGNNGYGFQQQQMLGQGMVNSMGNPMGMSQGQLYPNVVQPGGVVMPNGMASRPGPMPMNGMMQGQFPQMTNQQKGNQLYGSAQVSGTPQWGM